MQLVGSQVILESVFLKKKNNFKKLKYYSWKLCSLFNLS